jgi:hypothetical protein
MTLTVRLMSAFLAAIVASAMTTTLVALFLFITDPPAASFAVSDFFKNVLFTPLVGVPFGVVGAFIFLAPALIAISYIRPTRNLFVYGGALVGLIHSVFGWLYLLAIGSSANEWLAYIGLGLGFLLLAAARANWPVVASAAVLSGCVSGLVFWALFQRSMKNIVGRETAP